VEELLPRQKEGLSSNPTLEKMVLNPFIEPQFEQLSVKSYLMYMPYMRQ
jgi:hypothetical protein